MKSKGEKERKEAGKREVNPGERKGRRGGEIRKGKGEVERK